MIYSLACLMENDSYLENWYFSDSQVLRLMSAKDDQTSVISIVQSMDSIVSAVS